MEQQLHFASGLGMNLNIEGLPSDVQMVIVGQEQEEWSAGLEQGRLPHIKEEQEALWTSLNGVHFEGLEEAAVPLIAFPVKNELDEKPLSVLPHQSPVEETEPPPCSIKTEADEGATVDFHPAAYLQTDAGVVTTDLSEPETEVSEDDREPSKSDDDSEDDVRSRNGSSCSGESDGSGGNLKRRTQIHTGEQLHACPFCDKTYKRKYHMSRHMAVHDEKKRAALRREMRSQTFTAKMTQIPSQIDAGDDTSDSADPDDGDRDSGGHAPKSFSCSACSITFTKRRNLIIHMRNHTGQDPLFMCFVCGKCFTRKSGLSYHLNTHTGDRPYTCSVCDKNFARKGTLMYHLLTHTGEKRFSCGVCKKRFRGRSQLKCHKCVKDTCQLVTKPLRCHDCNETFPSKYLLLTHLRMHKGKKLYSCSVCGQKWQFKSHLKIHMRSHTGEKPHRCSVCGKGFSQKGIMTRHMAIHSEVKAFSCSVCRKGFYRDSQFKKHNCRGRLAPPSRLKNEDGSGKKTHVSSRGVCAPQANVKPDVQPTMLNCTFCSQVFAKGGHLTKHLSLHVGEKLLSCVICEKRFTLQTELARHKCFDVAPPLHKAKPKHVVDKKNICQEKIPRHEGLSAHMTSHTGEKPFVCSVCNAEHSDSESLVKHMRIHIEQTKFDCLICGKGFAWRRSLKKHMEVHARQENYKCDACDKRFMWPYQLTYHQCVPESSPPHRPEGELEGRSEREANGDDGGESQLQAGTDSADSLQTRGGDCDLPNAASESQPDSLTHADNEAGRGSKPLMACPSDKATEIDEAESDDSVDSDFWKENRQRKPVPMSAENEEIFKSKPAFDSVNMQYICPKCGRRFLRSSHMWNHMRCHAGEK